METETLKDLRKQRDEIPFELDRAIDEADAVGIVKARRRRDLLDQFIEAERLASIKNEIESKQEEKKSADQSLSELEPQLVEAKNEFLAAYKIAEDKYSAYGQIQVKAFALDQQHATVTDDLKILNRTLAKMKANLKEKHDG